MSNEVKRDLAADLALCDAATAGPWEIEESYFGGMRYDVKVPPNRSIRFFPHDVANARFIAEARTGWPDAIRRAIEAEDSVRAHDRACRREMRRLEAEVERLRKLMRYAESMYGVSFAFLERYDTAIKEAGRSLADILRREGGRQ